MCFTSFPYIRTACRDEAFAERVPAEEGMDAKAHWERIYHTFDPAQLSWYEEHPRLSLELIHRTGASKAAQIIDVGGGDIPPRGWTSRRGLSARDST